MLRLLSLCALSAALLAVSATADLRASEVTLTAGPKAVKDGDVVRITFTVSGPTDVEVAIMDAKGAVVRHLAAGVVGGKTPPPAPLEQGLAQSLEWDGKDDFSKPAQGGPFTVRVRAGTGVKWGRSISDSPYVVNDVRALATDADGNLYVLHQNFGYGSYYLQVFDAGGKYLRTILPFPADLPRGSVKAFAFWDEERNHPVPRNFMDVYAQFIPVNWKASKLTMLPRVSEAGVFLANLVDVYRLDLDGGTSGRPLRASRLFGLERVWPGKKHLSSKHAHTGAGVFITASPDGKTIYAAGPCSKADKDGKPQNANWPAGAIYSMAAGPKASLQPFAVIEMPADWPKRCAGPNYRGSPVHGLGVDGKGNVYAADRVHDRVAVLSPEGTPVASLPVRRPHRIAVHPTSGAVYVLTLDPLAYRRRKVSLVKFDGPQSEAPAAVLELGVHNTGDPQIAINAVDGETHLWLAGVQRSGMRVGRGDVTCYEDRGDTIVATLTLHERDPWALSNHDTIAVDPSTEDVYINDDYSVMYRFNGLTGRGGNLQQVRSDFYATDLTVGPDGYLYVRSGKGYSGAFERLDRDLKPVPFETGTHVLSKYIYSRYGAGYGEKGIGVGRDGTSYVMCMYHWCKYCVFGFGGDGKPLEAPHLKGKIPEDQYKQGLNPGVKGAVVGPVTLACGGVRVDSRGDIYLGMLLLPKDYAKPAVFRKDRAWDSMVGSVIRFGPQGGEWISTNPKIKAGSESKAVPAGVKALEMEAGNFLVGAKQVYPELAPFSGASGSARPAIGKSWCQCRSPRFDLDRYDRLYIPNAAHNRVRMVDNAGNEVLTFGAYGNYDSAGPGSAISTPDIPLAWPISVGVSDEHIYVCDQLNRRVVRVDKTYAAEAACAVK